MPAPKLPEMTLWEAFRLAHNMTIGKVPLDAPKLRAAIKVLREQKHLMRAAGPTADKAEAFLLASLDGGKP